MNHVFQAFCCGVYGLVCKLKGVMARNFGLLIVLLGLLFTACKKHRADESRNSYTVKKLVIDMKQTELLDTNQYLIPKVISLKSAEGIHSFIDNDKYNLYIAIVKHDGWFVQLPNGEHAPIDKTDFSFREAGEKKLFDFAYITIHGTPGEDGRLQGYFDMIGLPYSSCGMLVSALTFNKYVCNHYLKGFGVRIADSVLLRADCQQVDPQTVIDRLGLPLFVKPNDGGSSFGITKVKSVEELQPAIDKAFAEGHEVVIESFVKGTEVTCGCYKVKGKEVVLPLTEEEFQNVKICYDLPHILPKGTKKDQAVGEMRIYIANNLIFSEKIYTINEVD